MRLRGLGLLLLGVQTVFGAELVNPASVEVTPTNAVIRWVTDVPTGTKVRIDAPKAKVTVTQGESPATHHEVVISGLQPAVRYTIAVGTARVWLATNRFTTGRSVEDAEPSPPGEALSVQATSKPQVKAPPSSKTWGNVASLPDHFERHGKDFQAKDPEDYARLAWEFLQRAKVEGLPAKIDEDKVLRVFDPNSRTFAAYNRNGTTRTFFKPESPTYFERQPGKPVNLKTWR